MTKPVLLAGAERTPAIINATTMLGIGLGPGLHWPNLLLALFLGTAVHMVLRWMAKRDPQFFAVYLRHLSYQPHYRHFPDPEAPPAARVPLGRTLYGVLSYAVVRAGWGEGAEAAAGTAGVRVALALPLFCAAGTGGAGDTDQVRGIRLHLARASARPGVGKRRAARARVRGYRADLLKARRRLGQTGFT